MAVEAGATLSGMEFSVSYSLSPAWNSTRTLPYFAARFFAQGQELDIPPPMNGEGAHLKALAAAMMAGPVLADLGDAPARLKSILRRIQPASPHPSSGLDSTFSATDSKSSCSAKVRCAGPADCKSSMNIARPACPASMPQATARRRRPSETGRPAPDLYGATRRAGRAATRLERDTLEAAA